MISYSAYVSHLLSELWAMESRALEAMFNSLLSGKDIDAAIKGESVGINTYTIDGEGNARISIRGVMLKSVPWIFERLGISATSTSKTRSMVNEALADEDVKKIILDIDSPGGSTGGVEELALAVYNARKTKPVEAIASDLMASAAYWVGSQANTITANKGALIGSIGVYTVATDMSKMAESVGVKVHVISSGPAKGIGVAGAPITDKQLGYQQKLIDSMADLFVSEVAKGRDLSIKQIQKSATGEVWLADQAHARGLIDQVGENVKQEIADEVSDEDNAPEGAQQGKGEEMADQIKGQAPSELDEMKAKLAEVAEVVVNLRQQREEDNAKITELQESVKAVNEENLNLKKSSCVDVIKAGLDSGQILPSMLAGTEKYAEGVGYDVELVKAHVSALPIQTKVEQKSDTPQDNGELKPKTKIDPGVAAVMSFLGNTQDDIEKFGNAYAEMKESEVIQ